MIVLLDDLLECTSQNWLYNNNSHVFIQVFGTLWLIP